MERVKRKLISITPAHDYWAIYRHRTEDGKLEFSSDAVILWGLTSEGDIEGIVDVEGYLDCAGDTVNFSEYVSAKTAEEAEGKVYQEWAEYERKQASQSGNKAEKKSPKVEKREG